MARTTAPLIFPGTVANDGTGDVDRTVFQNLNVQVPWGTATYHAGAQISTATPAGTATQNAAVVQAAITYAVANGYTAVYVPNVLLPYTASLVTFNTAVRMIKEGYNPLGFFVGAYGARGDGTTDDTLAIQAAAAAQIVHPDGGPVVGQSGLTYIVGSSYQGLNTPADAQNLLRMLGDNAVWDFSGATLKYGGSVNITNGSDNNGLGVVNVLGSNCVLRGTIDCQSKAKFGLALQDNKVGTRLDIAILSPIETGGVWSSIITAVSSDLKGSGITTRHTNYGGFLKRPSCAIANNLGTITSHHDVTAFIIGDDNIAGNNSGKAIVGGGSGTGDSYAVQVIRTDIIGVPQFVFPNDANANLMDLVAHDLGCNVIEGNGTSVAHSSAYGFTGTDTAGFIAKNMSGHAYGHGNLGSDSTVPSLVIICRAAGQAEVDFDYNSAGGLAGGRTIYKQTNPATLGTGLDTRNQDQVQVTLSSNLTVGVPLNPRKGQRIVFLFIQDATGGRTVSWNAVFKGVNWSDTGNVANARSAVEFVYDGTNWQQFSAQSAYSTTPTLGTPVRVLFQASGLSTSSTSEVSITSFALPAGLLNTNGWAIRYTMRGRAVTQNCTPRCNFGATSVGAVTVTAGNGWQIDGIVTRTGATTQLSSGLSLNGGTIAAANATQPGETLANSITVDFRGSAVSGGTLDLDYAMVELLAI